MRRVRREHGRGSQCDLLWNVNGLLWDKRERTQRERRGKEPYGTGGGQGTN